MAQRFEPTNQDFAVRKRELLADCAIDAATFRDVVPRLEAFAQPFLVSMESPTDQRDGRAYLAGLLSDLPRKNAEAIAYRHDSDRQMIQEFLNPAATNTTAWKRTPLADELVRQVAREIGQPDAVIVFDPSAFAKKGTASVGVQRQWCGRLGKVENCQVGVYMAYVSSLEHALVDFRLYLPKEWAKAPKRCQKAGVPEGLGYKSRHELALEMLDQRGAILPHGWVSGDDEMGRPAWFRRALHGRHERYLLAVPSNTCVRDLEADPPKSSGRGRPRKRPFQTVRAWRESLPAEAWTRLTVRDGDKGPLEVEIAACRVESKFERGVADFEETLVVIRGQEGNTIQYDYYFSNGDRTTPLAEFARVAKAEHRVEECLKRGKSEAGLGDYQVRKWDAWHNHQLMSLIAQWFLVVESRRGKKGDAGVDRAAGPGGPGGAASGGQSLRHRGPQPQGPEALDRPQRTGTPLPLQVA